MSQYGLLYLVPWIIWLVLFPGLPISFQAERIDSIPSYCIFFSLLLLFPGLFNIAYCLWARYCFVLFTILVRYFGFPTRYRSYQRRRLHLRFGIFMVPLTFCCCIARGAAKNIVFFSIMSSVFFLFIEIGVGILAAAIVVAIVSRSVRNNACCLEVWCCLEAFSPYIFSSVPVKF